LAFSTEGIFSLGRLREYEPLGGGGSIAFDYGSKTVRMASAIDEPEASEIVQELKAQHPFTEAFV
jgi:hypothetical protein